MAISTLNDLGLSSGAPPVTDPDLYTSESNPLVGRLELSDISLGATWNTIADQGFKSTLAIYETEPGVSNLDLFWETSTGGLISELNTNIVSSDNTIPSSLETVTSTLNENQASGVEVTNTFHALNDAAVLSSASMTLQSVFDGYLTNVTSKFALANKGGGGYRLETNGQLWYSSDSLLNIFTVTVEVTSAANIALFDFSIPLANTAPSITDPTGTPTESGKVDGSDVIYTFVGENGADNATLALNELTWDILSQVDGNTGSTVSHFYMQQNKLRNTWGTDPLPATNPSRPLPYTVVVQVTDGGGLTDTQTMDVEISF